MIGLGQGMTYIPQESKVLYQLKDGEKENMFDALEWLAAMCSHAPSKGGADGPLLWLLQQCLLWEEETRESG